MTRVSTHIRVLLTLLTLAVCVVPLGSAFGILPHEKVDAKGAISAAVQYANGWMDPAETRNWDAHPKRITVGGEDYWVVTFRDVDGGQADQVALTSDGVVVSDPEVLRELDAWDSYLRREAPVPDTWWAIACGVVGLLTGGALYFWARKPRMGWYVGVTNIALVCYLLATLVGLFISIDIKDLRGVVAQAIPLLALATGLVYGLKRRGNYALVELPDGVGGGVVRAPTVPSYAPPSGVALGPDQAGDSPGGVPPDGQPAIRPTGSGGRAAVPKGNSLPPVIPPEELPNFGDVGGMEDLKKQLRESVGLLISHGDVAKRYGIDWNGVLLYGPPGVGKTFIAKATAGEFGLNFVDVRVSDVISMYSGESPKLISAVFEHAAKHTPCILFFDEFDSVGQRREDVSFDTEARRVVNQLLRELEGARTKTDLIVMAATNHKATLDEAVIRPGRFDRHIAIPLPDAPARRKVFDAQLEGRPVPKELDLADMVRRTDGMSAADITAVVNLAAMEALRRSVSANRLEEGAEQPIDNELLIGALEELRSKVSPTMAPMTWDDLVLADDTRAKLQSLQHQIENADDLLARGLDVPKGVLLYGPPGTGKTAIARVLASETDASFFAVDASELVSMWIGETSKNISRLFDEARKRRPSIIFIDEIDSLVPSRDEASSWSADVTSQFLREIDGALTVPGVFVLAATNIPDALDPALLRGGRLSRQMLIPAPDLEGRRRLFELYAERVGFEAGIDFGAIAADTDKLTGADIKDICLAAGLAAFDREAEKPTLEDLESARSAYKKDRGKFAAPDWMSEAWDEPAKKPTTFGFGTKPEPKATPKPGSTSNPQLAPEQE